MPSPPWPRWERESKPRINGCLQKRFQLLHCDLIECLGPNGSWLPNDDMGVKLLELREG